MKSRIKSKVKPGVKFGIELRKITKNSKVKTQNYNSKFKT